MIDNSGTEESVVNAPQVQWVLRTRVHTVWLDSIFGKCLAFDEGYGKSVKKTHWRSSAVVVRQRLRHAVDTVRPYDEIVRPVEELRHVETSTDNMEWTSTPTGPKLHLEGINGAHVVMTPTNFSAFSAHYNLPPNLVADTYNLSVSSPLAGGPQRTFPIEWFKSK